MSLKRNLAVALILLLCCCNSLKSKNFELESDREAENNVPEKALIYIDKAIEETPDKRRLYFKKSIYLMQLDRYEEALTAINFSIRLAKDINFEYSQKAKIFFKLNNLDSSFYYHDRSIRTSKNPEKAFHARAENYYQLKKYDIALEDLDRAIEFNPSYIEAYFTRGEIYLNGLSNYTKAIDNFSYAIDAKDRTQNDEVIVSLAYAMRGISYFKSDQSTLACSDWKMAVEKGYDVASGLIEDFCQGE